eukprot:COSAG02_NODE_1356_length_13093_cov_351.171695_2_plen_585_part_00
MQQVVGAVLCARMYNPEMMKMAQEQMSKMSPEQMAKMQEMARNMDPEMVKKAQASMAGMDPSVMKAAMSSENMESQMKRMESMTPEELKRQTEMAAKMGGGAAPAPAPAPAPLKPSTDPAVIKAVKLKDAGNSLLKTSDFNAAAKSYTDAIEALEDATDSAGKQPVWTACQLNLAHAHLQSENWARAAAACDRVCDSRSAMKSSATQLKAHYRRGRARKELGQLAEAAADLKIAKGLAGTKERGAIADLLTAVQKDLGEEEADIPMGKGGARIEEISEDDDGDSSQSHVGTPSSGFMPPGSMDQMADQMKNMDPNMMKSQIEMMDNMDDEALERMAEMSSSMRPGMPKMDAKQLRAQVSMMKSMDPEAMKKMTEMAKSMGGMPGMGGGGAAGGKKPSPEEAAKMMENLTPDQMKAMAESMKSMDPKAMKEMAKAAGMDMPDINPEMMAQAAEQMGNLSPEQMQKMMKMATGAQKCMSVCAKPIAAVRWVVSWIPAQFRRSVFMGLAAVLVYWLFMGGGGAASAPASSPSPGTIGDSEGCNPNPCHNGGKCVEPGTDDSDSFACECPEHYEGHLCEEDHVWDEDF